MNIKEKIETSLKIDPDKVRKKIVKFIRNNIEKAGVKGAVIGLSGGIDSSTVSYLCVEAIGREKVLNVFMPEKKIKETQSKKDAKKVSEDLDTSLEIVQITPIIDEIKKAIEPWGENKLAVANIKPRVRMTILYYYANLYNYLVIGTSNKSEIKSGYFTKYGDGASDLAPIGDLYKTQVKKIAKEIGVPENIISKPPTAGLWKGQRDEKELGLPYKKIDRIYAGLELGLDHSEIAKAINVKQSEVEKFEKKEKNSKHKLGRPPLPELE